MNKTTQEWKKILKNLNMQPWRIGTNTFTYLENSLFEWWDKINWDLNLNFKFQKVKAKDDELFKVVFEQNENIIFYKSKDEFYSKSTTRQLLDILKSLEIIQELDKEKYKIHSKFKNFFISSNKNEGIKKIFWSFFIENIDPFLKKYICEKLDFYENEDENENVENIENVENTEDGKKQKKQKNIESKFWWNIVLAYESLSDKKIISDIISPKSGTYFDDFAQQIIYRKHSLEEFYNNFLKITGFEYTRVWDSVNILKNSSIYDERKMLQCNVENCETNHTWLDHKILKASEGNKFESFAIAIPELFELSSLLELPIFQRTYSWNENIISHLFESIYNDFNSNSNDFTFLNTIIIAEPGWKKLVILDGQQRTVSITLITIALARWAKQNHEKTLEKIQNQNNNMQKTIETWLKTDPNYQNLNFIFLGDNFLEKLDKKTNFSKNYYEICKLIQRKFQNQNLDFPLFVDYFLSKIHFVVAYVGRTKDDSSKMTKIFQNLNQYSKPLGILDLFRNQIYEFYKNKENKENKNAENYVLIYNQTINLFFRKNNKIDEAERVNVINVFADTIFIKYEQFSDLKEIDEKYYDPIAKILQKLWKIFDYFNAKDLNPLLEMFKELIDFQFCLDGVISNFKISHLDNEDKTNKKYNFFYKNLETLSKKTHLANQFMNELIKYSEKIAEYDFLGAQIMHISGQGKTVFAPLISLLKKRANIDFSNDMDSNNLNSKVSYFSKQLFEIEKFSILWIFNFEGQSLTKKINKICENISKGKMDDTNLLSYLKWTINLDNNKNDEDWGNEIYTKLLDIFNSDYEIEKKNTNKNGNLRLIWIRLIYGMNDEQTPKYYNKNSTSLDLLNSTYEHCIPKKLTDPKYNKYNKEDRTKLQWYAENNIGNGALLTQKANSKRGNNFDKINPDFYNTTIIGGKMSGKLIISIKDNAYNLNGTVLELLPSPEKLNEQNSSLTEIINYIKKRGAQVLLGYVSIFFGSNNK